MTPETAAFWLNTLVFGLGGGALVAGLIALASGEWGW
jgi:hypothetical protein